MSTPRISPVWLVLAGIVSVQLGAVVSKGLFDEIPPLGMVLLRLSIRLFDRERLISRWI